MSSFASLYLVLSRFGLFLLVLGHFMPPFISFWLVFGCFGSFWLVVSLHLGASGLFWVVSARFDSFWLFAYFSMGHISYIHFSKVFTPNFQKMMEKLRIKCFNFYGKRVNFIISVAVFKL